MYQGQEPFAPRSMSLSCSQLRCLGVLLSTITVYCVTAGPACNSDWSRPLSPLAFGNGKQHDELTLLQTAPKLGFVLPRMMNSEWAELMHELQIVQLSYSRMLFGDQLNAVRDFEIATRIEQKPDEHGELVPTDVEYVKSHFPEPFLASMFGSVWKDIAEAGLEPAAMVELKKISVDRIPGS